MAPTTLSTALIALATDRLNVLLRRDEFLTQPDATILSAPWAAVKYQRVSFGDHSPTSAVVVLRHATIADDYVAFMAHTRGTRQYRYMASPSEAKSMVLSDSARIWGEGVQGAFADVLDWARQWGGHVTTDVLSIPSPDTCRVPEALYGAAVMDMLAERRVVAHLSPRYVVETLTDYVFVPETAPVDSEFVATWAEAHLHEWVDAQPAEFFLNGVEEVEDEMHAAFVGFLSSMFPNYLV